MEPDFQFSNMLLSMMNSSDEPRRNTAGKDSTSQPQLGAQKLQPRSNLKMDEQTSSRNNPKQDHGSNIQPFIDVTLLNPFHFESSSSHASSKPTSHSAQSGPQKSLKTVQSSRDGGSSVRENPGSSILTPMSSITPKKTSSAPTVSFKSEISTLDKFYQLSRKIGSVPHFIFLEPVDLEFRMGQSEFEKAPRGRYSVELIISNRRFFGHGEYPLQAQAQAANSASTQIR